MTFFYKPFDYEAGIYAEDNPWYGKECVVLGKENDKVRIVFLANGKRYTDEYLVDEKEVEKWEEVQS